MQFGQTRRTTNRAFIIIFWLLAQVGHAAEPEQQVLERTDAYLGKQKVRAAIAVRTAWLARQIADRLALAEAGKDPDENMDPNEYALAAMKREFDRLNAHLNVKYRKSSVPAQWSKHKDSYEFGYVKGVFDAIRSDDPPIYDGQGDKFEAFAAGWIKGFKEGKVR